MRAGHAAASVSPHGSAPGWDNGVTGSPKMLRGPGQNPATPKEAVQPSPAAPHQATSTDVPTAVSFQASIKPPRSPERPADPQLRFQSPSGPSTKGKHGRQWPQMPAMCHIWSSQGCPTPGGPTSGCPNSWMLQLEAAPAPREGPGSPTISSPIPGMGIAPIPFPAHLTAPIPAALHTHPSRVSTSKLPKKQQKGETEASIPPLTTHSALTGAPLHSTLPHSQAKKQPVIKHKSKLENTGEPLVETSEMFPSSRSLENCFRQHKRQQALPSLRRAESFHLQSQLTGTQLSE